MLEIKDEDVKCLEIAYEGIEVFSELIKKVIIKSKKTKSVPIGMFFVFIKFILKIFVEELMCI